ncbi:MAG: DUF6075 family protein [Candidatus Gastranaerophilales bacterium]|nr:DUF6075 family protein [Candidatus Gastranaerophilales bacterium]
MKVRFSCYGHKEFYIAMEKCCKVWDCYHKAFFYCIGISEDARKNINQLFDFSTDQIKPETINEAWQTSGSKAVCRLAFNLWNGYIEEESPKDYTPDSIFCCSYAKWFWQAIRLRYAEYVHEETYIVKDSENHVLFECDNEFMANQYKIALEKRYSSDLVVEIAPEIILDID